jgi:hypothetical protein
MRLIDILNKIVNDEVEDGTKVIYQGMEFVYDGKDLACVGDFDIYFYIDDKEDLEEVVELIEPDHFADDGKMANHFREDTKMIEPTDNTKIEELDKEEMLCLTLQCAIAVLTDKFNEVISYINKED